MTYGLDEHAVERIVRRAVELADTGNGQPTDEDRLAAVHAAAAELGLDPAAVRLAVAEERVGALGPVEPPRRSDRWVGVATVVAHRIVEGPASMVTERVDRVLRHSHGLRRWEQMGPVVRYGRRSDLGATMQRTARSLRGMPLLQVVNVLGVMVEPVDDESSVVALRADLRGARMATEVAGGGVAVAGTAGSAVAALQFHPAFMAASAGAVGAGYAVGRTHQWRVERARSELDAVLDEIVAGVEPPNVWRSAREAADRWGARRPRRWDADIGA